jgi:hypothetical protein
VLALTLLVLGQAVELDQLSVRDATSSPVVQRGEQAPFGVANTRTVSLTSGEVTLTVVEVTTPRSPTLRGYLKAWRSTHGCTAKERTLPPITRAGLAPPQLAFGGSCEGGDVYEARVFLAGGRGGDDVPRVQQVGEPRGKAPDLDAAMASLVARLEFKPAPTR